LVSNRGASVDQKVIAPTLIEGSSKSVSVFDPLMHHPPRIDHKGYNKETHHGRELFKRQAMNALD